jgi:signal transduction histidine kinase
MPLINFLFGMIAMQLLFLLFFFIFLKRKEFIFFLFFALGVSSFVYMMIQPREFFLSRGIAFDEFLPLPFGILFISLGLYFSYTRFFIDAPQKHLLFNKVLQWSERIAFITGFFFLIKFFFYPDLKYVVEMGKIVFLLNIFLQVYIVGYLILVGGVVNILHLAGSLIMSIYFKLVIIPIAFGAYDYKNYTNEVPGMLFGMVINFMIFNFIMIYNYRKTEQEKFTLKIQKNEELELQRREISNDLHDDMGSILSGLQVYAGIAIKDFNSGGDKTLHYLDKISGGVKVALNNLGDVIWAARNDQASDKTLTGRLKDFFIDIFDARNIESIYDIDSDVEALITGVISRKYLMLVAKEAINNAIKHSNPTIIRVQLKAHLDNLCLMIEDNGCGFDVDKQMSNAGFFTIRDRVANLGGNLTIHSTIGIGTKVECVIPIPIIREK